MTEYILNTVNQYFLLAFVCGTGAFFGSVGGLYIGGRMLVSMVLEMTRIHEGTAE